MHVVTTEAFAMIMKTRIEYDALLVCVAGEGIRMTDPSV